jgi:DnaJ family protein C protein 13
MQEGNLSSFDLVASSHVEEYDFELDEKQVKDSHIDTGKWKRLEAVWQLRWQLCTDGIGDPVFTANAVSLLALKSLSRLIDLHRSHDSRGVLYYPIPTAKRLLCGIGAISNEMGSRPLPILCQALLCRDSAVVDHAADLIFKLVQNNDEAMSKLYLTGLFYFACTYPGSNVSSLSRLLHATHLNQNFRSGFSAVAGDTELPLKARSILGSLLPEGLLFVLVNYGPDRFAEYYVGNVDTPEVIWTFEMRKYLIEMIHQHLGDFPLRLMQNNTIEYEYCPIPSLSYKRLEAELFCHNYYLQALCDEVRFPDWPVAEPVELFRACLDRFMKQFNLDQEAEDQARLKAAQVLKLSEGDGSKELRKAYRSLALQFHPDKNPSGRSTFEAIQSSYELLLPLVESGQTVGTILGGSLIGGNAGENYAYGLPGGCFQMKAAHLLIKAQLLVCRRYEKEMSNYKYPAYQFLLDCLRLPDDCVESLEARQSSSLADVSLAKTERMKFVLTATELVYRTCLVSPLNSEELVVESGVSILSMLMIFYLRLFDLHCGIEARRFEAGDSLTISTFACRTLSGVAFFESGRNGIRESPNLHRFLSVWKTCVDGSFFRRASFEASGDSIARYALEGVAHMAKDRELQQMLIGSGAVWVLIRLLLLFDKTVEQNDANDKHDDVSKAQCNTHAHLAANALAMLSGMRGSSTFNEALVACLMRLLTEPITRLLRNKYTGEMLRVLNSNIETADVIWNASMRRQLELFLADTESKRPAIDVRSVDEELRIAHDFSFDSLRDEVRIGDVYLRVFIKSGKEAVTRVQDPPSFLRSVIDFIARSLNSLNASDWVEIPVAESESVGSLASSDVTSPAFLMALNALRILVGDYGIVDDVYTDEPCKLPAVLFGLLTLDVNAEVRCLALV